MNTYQVAATYDSLYGPIEVRWPYDKALHQYDHVLGMIYLNGQCLLTFSPAKEWTAFHTPAEVAAVAHQLLRDGLENIPAERTTHPIIYWYTHHPDYPAIRNRSRSRTRRTITPHPHHDTRAQAKADTRPPLHA